MSYADPQSVTINAVPISLPRTGSGDTSGAFSSADGLVGMIVSHQLAKNNRVRSLIKLTQTKVTADPLFPTQNIRPSVSVSLIIDRPLNGFTIAEDKYVADALVAYLTASSGAKVTQLLGRES